MASYLDEDLQRYLRERGRDLRSEAATTILLTLDPGHAILHIGAGQDLNGNEAYTRLEQCLGRQGLKCVVLKGEPTAAHGVGGRAKPLFNALVPCVLGRVPGVIKVTVVQENIPQLLSVGLLESTVGNCASPLANLARHFSGRLCLQCCVDVWSTRSVSNMYSPVSKIIFFLS